MSDQQSEATRHGGVGPTLICRDFDPEESHVTVQAIGKRVPCLDILADSSFSMNPNLDWSLSIENWSQIFDDVP